MSRRRLIISKKTRTKILNRFLISLGIILFIRMGSFLPVPGINHTDLIRYVQMNPSAKNFINAFISEENLVISLFTLNIFPYVNATIIIQLLSSFSPSIAKLQKENDLTSRRSLNRLIRIITLVWSIVQSFGLGFYLKQILFNWSLVLVFQIVLWLTTGAMIILWLSELITDYGLGNGASLLISVNILTSFPTFYKTLTLEVNENFNFFSISLVFILICLTFAGIILLQEGVRHIPLISARQLGLNMRLQESRFLRSYIPIKLNQAGVMPVILTSAVLVLPNYLINLGILPEINFGGLEILSKIIYWISYFVLVLTFSSFYAIIVLNPYDMSEQLQKAAVAIPGIRPGPQTTFYLKRSMQRLTFMGAGALAILASVPNLIQAILKISNVNGLSTTSLIILAGVLIEVSREIEEIIYSNIYNNI